MIAYKAFEPGLICRGFRFTKGLNVTAKANCRENGFHCAENPLDCLTYYSDMDRSVYCLVDAGGDINEDGNDSKIACTELTIIKQLTREEFFLHGLAYIVDHPFQKQNYRISVDRAKASNGFAIVRGIDPIAQGSVGDILAFAKEYPLNRTIAQVSLARVDGVKILPAVWYGVDLTERRVG